MAMRRDKRAELRMLREVAHYFLPRVKCFFCHRVLLKDGSETFGHHNHAPVDAEITVHHVNGNHGDNRGRNRRLVHRSCHKRFHMKEMHKQGRL